VQIFEEAGAQINLAEAAEKGAYRVEVYLDSLGFTETAWIMSNPIYLR
jgi:hypothetical protein